MRHTNDGMSEGEYQAMMDMQDDGFLPPRPVPTETTWLCKNGDRVRVKDMADQHLIHTIRFLRRRVIHFMLRELRPIGRYMETAPDGARDAAEMDAFLIMAMSDDQYLSYRIPNYRVMLDEAKKRKLCV